MKDALAGFFIKVLWPVLREIIKEAFRKFCLWVIKKIIEIASTVFDERAARASAKAKEAEQKAADAQTAQEAEVFTAEAKTWAAAANMFGGGKEEVLQKLEEFQLDALKEADEAAEKIPENKALEKYTELGSSDVDKSRPLGSDQNA